MIKNIFILFTLLVFSKVSYSACSLNPSKGECVTPTGNGWEIPKSHMWNKTKSGKNFVEEKHLKLNWALPTTYTSHHSQGKQCNSFINTPDIFYHRNYKKEGDFKPKQNETEDNNLRDFMLMFKNWRDEDNPDKFDKEKLREDYNFNKNSERMSAERLFHSSDEGMKQGKGKSVCSALGLCLCVGNYEFGEKRLEGRESAGCVPIGNFEGLDEPLNIDGVEYRRTLGRFSIDVSHFKDYDDTCYFLDDCKSGDNSPKLECEAGGGSLCETYSTKCLYRDTCILPPSNKDYNFENLTYKKSGGSNASLKCTHDLECGSKKCQRIPHRIVSRVKERLGVNLEGGKGVCLPTSICHRGCIGETDPLLSSNDYCCPGLVNIDGYCQSMGENLNPVPEFESYAVDENACKYAVRQISPSITTDNGYCLGNDIHTTQEDCHAKYEKVTQEIDDMEVQSCEKNGVVFDNLGACYGGIWINDEYELQLLYLANTRTIEGLQWLWGKADSPGVNHMFGTYKIAVNIGEQILENYKTINDEFYGKIDGIKNKLSRLTKSGGSADGVDSIKAMSELFTAQSEKDEALSEFYYQISGYEEFTNTYTGILEGLYLLPGRIPSKNYDPENNTLFHLLYELNSRNGYLNDKREKRYGTGRYNLAQGRHGCGFWGRRIWKKKDKMCDRNQQANRSGGAHPNCDGWGDPWDTIRDGDCIKEGWRIDDPSGGFFGSPGNGGGILDGIYPSTLQNSSASLYIDQFKNYFNLDLTPSAYAGTNRTEIGTDPTPISSEVLKARILRDWKAFSSEQVTMDGQCSGGSRNQVVPNMGVEELFLFEKLSNPSLTKEEWDSIADNRSEDTRNEKYHQVMSNLLFNFFVGFHYHGTPGWRDKLGDTTNHEGAASRGYRTNKKRTYRYFRDGMNMGEYNSTINLINASIWLHQYHIALKKMNEDTATCLLENADALGEAYKTSGGSILGDSALNSKLVGDTSETYVNCDGGNDGAGPSQRDDGTTDAPGTVYGAVEYSTDSMGLSDRDNDSGTNNGELSQGTGGGQNGAIQGGGGDLSSNVENVEGTGNSATGQSGNVGGTGSSSSAKSKIKKASRLALKKDPKLAQKMLNDGKKTISDMLSTPSLKTVLNPKTNFTPATASLAPIDTSVGSSAKPKMSDEEAEAFELLQALQAQNDSGGGGSRDLDFDDDDDLEDVSSGGGGESGVDPDLVKAVEKNLEKYKAKEDDNLWKKISKTYMREGLRRLVRKRKIKNKKLPSLQKNKKRKAN